MTKMNQLEEFALSMIKLCVKDDEEIIAHDKSFGVEIDFYLPKRSLSIFVDGSYWHDLPGGGKPMTRFGVRCLSNDDVERGVFWIRKANTNRQRDLYVNKLLKSKGIIVVRLSEEKLNGRDPLAYVSGKLAKAFIDSLVLSRTLQQNES